MEYCSVENPDDSFCSRWLQGNAATELASVGPQGRQFNSQTPEREGVRVVLTIPRGGLSTSATIGITSLDVLAEVDNSVLSMDGVYDMESDLIALTPHGTKFDLPVQLEVPFYTPSGESRLHPLRIG